MTTLTIYTDETGSEVVRTMSRYGAKVISHNWDADGSEIVVECHKDVVDGIEEYLNSNEDVLDYCSCI